MDEGADVVIEKLGAGGDGVATRNGRPHYIRFALPGERWRIASSDTGDAPQPLSLSPHRRSPPCAHFGTCGGCVAQHMSPELYEAWKLGIVREAFAHRGLDIDLLALCRMPERSRRRAQFGVERKGRTTLIGFREDGQHTLVDLTDCLVLDQMILTALPLLRQLAEIAMPDQTSGRLAVTRLDAGLDVSFDNGHKMLRPEERGTLARLVSNSSIIRLTVSGDPIVMAADPALTIAGVTVMPPPSAFLQAVAEAERILSDFILEHLPRKAKRVVDLFCGIGTFTFPLARRASVTAFDSDRRALATLEHALRHAKGLKPVEVRQRDLFREPLSATELNAFDAVVFDPPRAGAALQAERLAKSRVPLVIAISCAPTTLARDARVLIDGGYEMGPLFPIDQFVYSPHLEVATVFARPGR